MRTAFALLLLVACKSSPRGGAKPDPGVPPKALPPVTASSAGFSSEPRTAKPRSTLPEGMQTLVPRHGIYAAGGGLMSSAWRIVVELDGHGTATLRAGKNDKPNAPSTGGLSEVTRPLDAATTKDVVACADRVWREHREFNQHPTADYDELIIVADGDDTFFLEGYGPLHGGAAEQCIDQLRALRPESP